jgi:hypothetical protein
MIIIGDGVYINNNAILVAGRSFIRIDANTHVRPDFKYMTLISMISFLTGEMQERMNAFP